MIARAIALAALLVLSACGPLFARCNICLESPPEQPVAKEELGRIQLFVDARIPKSARDIYFDERCGKDCTHWLRFTAPEDDTRKFAELAVRGKLRAGFNPIRGPGGPRGPKLAWWPDRFPAGFEGGYLLDSYSVAAVIARSNGDARIWLYEASF